MVLPKRWLPRWRTGCGCWSLETCCKVQGYIYLVISVAFAVSVLFGMYSVRPQWACAVERKVSFVERSSVIYQTELCQLQQISSIFLSDLLIFYYMVIGATVSFLRGIYKREAHMLIMFNWYRFAYLVFDIIVLLWVLFRQTEDWSSLLSRFFMTGLRFYMLLCSETLYHQLQEARPRRPSEAQ